MRQWRLFWKLKCPEKGCDRSFWLSKNYEAHLHYHTVLQKQIKNIQWGLWR